MSNVLVYNINLKTGESILNRQIINKKNTNIEKVCLELMNIIPNDLKTKYNFNISDKTSLLIIKRRQRIILKRKYIKKKTIIWEII